MPDLKILLLGIVVICSVARALGWAFEKLHQPRVVGEMFAGILLGPSLLGWLAPPAFTLLFPPGGLAPLYFLSQIGLLLFMFQVGVGLDLQELRRLGRTVVITSNISVLVPLVAGSTLALYLYPRLSNAKVPLPVFALFMGTAMSVTAFPVLARILEERNLLQTPVGVVTISCAAVDDITAWCLLAGLTAWVRSGKESSPWFTLAGLGAYLLVMICVVRPLLGRYRARERETLAFALLLLFFSAWTTERIAGLIVHGCQKRRRVDWGNPQLSAGSTAPLLPANQRAGSCGSFRCQSNGRHPSSRRLFRYRSGKRHTVRAG